MERNKLDRASIMNTAALIAEEAKLENLTLKGLADRLNVKTPSLYNHVSGLKDVAAGIAAVGTQRLSRRLATAAVGKADDDAVWAIAREYRNFARENPEIYKAMLSACGMDEPEVREAENVIAQILGIVLEPYGLNRGEAFHLTRGLRSAMHGFIALEDAGFFRAGDTDESYEKMIRVFLKSVRGTQQAAKPRIEMTGEFYL